MTERPRDNVSQPTPDESSLRALYQPCVEIYPGWKLGYIDSEFLSVFSPRGLELTLPGGELDPDDWEGITEAHREKVREDEIEAKVIFRCIQYVQRKIADKD